MGKILLILCLGMFMFSTAFAETIVRHERTMHGFKPPTQERPVMEEASLPESEEDFIVVYGPEVPPPPGVENLGGLEVSQGQEGQKASSAEAARARLEKFLGQEPPDEKFWFKRGEKEGIPYIDSIYTQGGTKGSEDYVIALQRQRNPDGHASDYFSLVVMVGRGLLGQLTLDQQKLPILSVKLGEASRQVDFTQTWTKLPELLMLRIELDWVQDAAAADEAVLILATSAGDKHIELPKEVRESWREVMEWKSN